MHTITSFRYFTVTPTRICHSTLVSRQTLTDAQGLIACNIHPGAIRVWVTDTSKFVHASPRVGCDDWLKGKVSAGNSGHRKTPDTLYVSAMDEPFGLKRLVLKCLPLGYIQTKNELKAQRHCAANLRFVY